MMKDDSAILEAPSGRAARAVTNLARVFRQFADAQQQVAEQVMTLEESLNQVIANSQEQSQRNAVLEERLNR